MLKRPFRRTCRQFPDGSYANSGQAKYIEHPLFAEDPDKYIRMYFLIQDDYRKILEFVDPDDRNQNTYSFRINELLMRICVEVETNLKAILIENEYSKTENLTMRDYRKVEASHLLSGYRVIMPYWHGIRQIRQPFGAWSEGRSLPWYNAYNASKHDRHVAFTQATFGHLTEAICGLVALLSAQFIHMTFPLDQAF